MLENTKDQHAYPTFLRHCFLPYVSQPVILKSTTKMETVSSLQVLFILYFTYQSVKAREVSNLESLVKCSYFIN